MGRELRIQLGENKGDKYTTWREQGRHVRKQMADEKNQGSQQAPRKKNSKRERERKKERKKEKKKDRKEHLMSILCPGSTQREQQQRRKKERRARNGDNKDDKYGNRQWTRSIRWASCAPEAPRENKWETKRRRVSCAQKHPGRRTVTGMDQRNGERRTATQMKDSGMFIAPKHLEVLKPRHTWETRRILGPKST